MHRNTVLKIAVSITFACVVASPLVVSSQNPAAAQITAVRAGRMFDPKSGTNLSNQVVLIRGDRITEVGPATRLQIPAGAKVIDLSNATVLPGLIDGHVHLTDGKGDQRQQALRSATESLKAGYTTLVTQGSHGESSPIPT
jgi:imidazolonepropionase-like amidohydrolase